MSLDVTSSPIAIRRDGIGHQNQNIGTSGDRKSKLPPIDLNKFRTDSAIQRVLRNVNSMTDRSQADVTKAHMQNMTVSLFKSVVDGRLSRVRFLLGTAGLKVDVRNDLGQNLLIASLHTSDADKRRRMFDYLLKHVDRLNADITTGRDVITWAAILNRPDQVRQTLDMSGGDVDLSRSDYNGLTALHYAAAAGHLNVVDLLVAALTRYRLSVDLRDQRIQRLTPYLYARHNGHTEVADALVRAGANRFQFDTSTFMTGDDWERLGLEQRRRKLVLTDANVALLRGSQRGRMTARSSDPRHGHPLVNTGGGLEQLRRCEGDSAPSRDFRFVTKSSVDTLLDLHKLSPGGSTVERFVSSIPDTDVSTDKVKSSTPHVKLVSPLSKLMDALAIQQSPSYRPPRVAPLPPYRASKRRRNFSRKKFANLALTMGRQERRVRKSSLVAK